MSYCPKCKEEFQDQITECPVCNIPLVDVLDDSVLVTEMEFFSEEEIHKFIAFLEYSNIQDVTFEKNPVSELFSVRCKENDVMEIKKLFKAYKLGEAELQDEVQSMVDFTEDTLDENSNEFSQETSKEMYEESARSSKPYVKKRDQYADTSSTGLMLLIIGILGVGYVVLNYLDILSFLNGAVPYTLNIVLFTASTIYGIYSLVEAKKIKGQIEEEETLHAQLLEWLNAHATKEYLEQVNDPSLPQEANCLRQFQAMKHLLVTEYPTLNEAFIESIVDEKMNAEE